ncbi:ADP-ribosylglycohydrolase family protein, partial [Klebsiella pneumoniae]|uniref:ADP-ribosylglycohydrolase family protein n=1 Tax=Klebsiella pneumoniae TaxID=573 RepID=UPI001BAD6A87
MKIWPAAVLHPGDIDAAIDCALQICRFTHNNVLAMPGAATTARATSEAVGAETNADRIIAEGIDGEKRVYLLAQELG